jgi:hypothetical protein
MNMNSPSYLRPVLLLGLVLWLVGTIASRLVGNRLLHADQPLETMVLYLFSFVIMGLLVQRIFQRLGLERDSWPTAVTLLMLPTLVLDPFSCGFFRTVFPNVDPAAAGVFGGWMLMFCGGAVAGAWVKL